MGTAPCFSSFFVQPQGEYLSECLENTILISIFVHELIRGFGPGAKELTCIDYLMGFIKKMASPVVWGNLLGMMLFVALMIAGAWYGTMIYTHHGEVISVPDVSRIHHTDAALLLSQYELDAVVADSGYNRNLAAGSVLMQQPRAGTRVKSGRKVYLTVNSGNAPTLTMPDIADNCDAYEAEIRLRAMGFKLGPKEYVPGDKDWVIGVKCRGREVRAGEKVPAEAPVVLVVGNNLTEDEQWEEEEARSGEAGEEEYEFEPETEW